MKGAETLGAFQRFAAIRISLAMVDSGIVSGGTRLRQSACVTFLVAACLATAVGSSRLAAQSLTEAVFAWSVLDGTNAPVEPIGRWTTTVTAALPALARDPNWGATVVSWRASPVTTASIAPHDRRTGGDGPRGPRLTGAGHALTGFASFYGQGDMTAMGEKFDPNAMTAAHRTLPFGTRVRVTRLDTGNSVVVRINDRGPFKAGRVIDLSERAAENLGMTAIGVTPVKLEVLGE